jgi:hypothetical protein
MAVGVRKLAFRHCEIGLKTSRMRYSMRGKMKETVAPLLTVRTPTHLTIANAALTVNSLRLVSWQLTIETLFPRLLPLTYPFLQTLHFCSSTAQVDSACTSSHLRSTPSQQLIPTTTTTMSDNEGSKGKVAGSGWTDRERVLASHSISMSSAKHPTAHLPRQPNRALRHQIQLQGQSLFSSLTYPSPFCQSPH